MLALVDAEVFAHRAAVRAQLDGHDRPPWCDLLEANDVELRMFGGRTSILGLATNAIVKGVGRVYVHEDLPDRERAFSALHEFGHVVIKLGHHELACDEERWCNRFAAASMLPSASMHRAWRACGLDLPALRLARPHVVESALVLRVGELALASAWLYEGDRLRYGDSTTRGIHGLAKAARRFGVAENDFARAWRLEDDPRRVGVLCAAA